MNSVAAALISISLVNVWGKTSRLFFVSILTKASFSLRPSGHHDRHDLGAQHIVSEAREGRESGGRRGAVVVAPACVQ